MPRYSIDQKAEMLKKANEADQKAKRYANDAKAYGFSASRGKGPLGLDYTVGRDAANKMANIYEEEAEILRQRAMPSSNSRAQYNAEKAAGDPYATSMSFEEWKNLD